MSNERGNQTQANDGRVRQPVETAGRVMDFDLAQELKRLMREQPWQAEHTANTIVKYPDLRLVLMALKGGALLKEHRTAGRIAIQMLSGAMTVKADGQVHEMTAGKLLTLEQDVAHEVEARTDSVFLLTIAWPK